MSMGKCFSSDMMQFASSRGRDLQNNDYEIQDDEENDDNMFDEETTEIKEVVNNKITSKPLVGKEPSFETASDLEDDSDDSDDDSDDSDDSDDDYDADPRAWVNAFAETNKIVAMPMKGKKPTLKQWTKFTTSKPIKNTQNIGFVCGPQSNLFVVDLDTHSETENGIDNWNKLIDGIDIQTFICNTAGGGQHWFFKYNKRIHTSTTGIYPSIDIRTDGGCIVAPSSSIGENKYVPAFDHNNFSIEIAEAPKSIIKILRRKRIRTTKDDVDDEMKLVDMTNGMTDNTRAADDYKWIDESTLLNIYENLNPARFKDYAMWRNLCFATRDIYEAHGNSDWIAESLENISKKIYGINSYKQGESTEMMMRGSRYSFHSILAWLKDDNPEIWENVNDKQIQFESSIFKSIPNTSTNRAQYFDWDDKYYYIDFYQEILFKPFHTLKALYESLIKNAPRVCFYLVNIGFYIKTADGISVISMRELSAVRYVEMTYSEISDKGIKKTKKINLFDFINRAGLTFSKIVYDEFIRNPLNKNEFNIFVPPRARILENPLEIYNDNEELRTAVRMFKELIFMNFATENQEYYDYIMSWFHTLLTKRRTETALCICSKEGIGKNMISNFFKYFIFSENAVYEASGVDGVTSQFNEHIGGMKLVIINELSSTKDEFRKNFDIMKSFITDDYIDCKGKYKVQKNIANVSSFMMFTNHMDALSISPGERRYFVNNGGVWNRQNSEYFGRFKDFVYNQDAGNLIYTMLSNNINFDDFLPYTPVNIRNIPMTKLKNELIMNSRINIERYISEVHNDFVETTGNNNGIFVDKLYGYDENGNIDAKTFYEEYEIWCRNDNEKIYTRTKFGTIAGKIIKKIRTNHQRLYNIAELIE